MQQPPHRDDAASEHRMTERSTEMRKLIMWNLVTLDGFFEGPQSWDIGFHEHAWGEELEQYAVENSKSTEALVFGRVTYEGMAAYWPSQTGAIADFMNSVPKIVASRTLKAAEWSNSTLVKDEAVDEIARLKQQPGKDMFVFGSANLSASLTEHGLFDEYHLCVVPVLLGDGNPLFKRSPRQRPLTLLDARPLKTGAVIVHYRVEPES
jgi:dihydrofolate reductase